MEVTPMMDRNLIILCNTQLGFIDFVVAPLLSGEYECECECGRDYVRRLLRAHGVCVCVCV